MKANFRVHKWTMLGSVQATCRQVLSSIQGFRKLNHMPMLRNWECLHKNMVLLVLLYIQCCKTLGWNAKEAPVSSPVDGSCPQLHWAVRPSPKRRRTKPSCTHETIAVERLRLTLVLHIIAAYKCNAIVATSMDVQT